MAVSAKRFSFLDKETNLGTSDLYKLTDTDPRNSAVMDVTEVIQGLGGMLNKGDKQAAKALLDKVKKNPLSAARVTKDFFSGKMNGAKLVSESLDSVMESMFGNDNDIANTIRQMAKKCQEYMMGGMGSRKPARKKFDCGGSKRHDRGTPCNINLFNDLLSKISGSDFGAKVIDTSSTEKMIAGVGAQGYGIGLCNVWDAVTAGVKDKGLLSRAAGTLLGRVASNSDMMAVRDIGRSLQDGVNVVAAVPGIASTIMSNFKLPSEVNDAGLNAFNTGFGLSMNNIDPNWVTSSDGLPSLANFSNDTMDDACRMLGAGAFDKSFSVDDMIPDNFEVPDLGNDEFLYAGASMGVDDAMDSFNDDFSSMFA